MKSSEITDEMRLAMLRAPALRSPLQPPKPTIGMTIKATIPFLATETAPAGVLVPEPGIQASPGHPEPNSGVWEFTIPGPPVGKPRQTQSDKWKKRPCVMRYRAWADKARAAAPKDLPVNLREVHLKIWLPFPKSWRPSIRGVLKDQPHQHRPDVDNLAKSCLDALFEHDECVSVLSVEKRWDDGAGPRMEVRASR